MSKTPQVTSNYSLFSFLPGNRELVHSHVKKLVASISQHNMLEENPILVTEDFKVIDGQHRLEAAKMLNLPIYYTVIDKASVREVVLLNNAQLSWSLLDYINN